MIGLALLAVVLVICWSSWCPGRVNTARPSSRPTSTRWRRSCGMGGRGAADRGAGRRHPCRRTRQGSSASHTNQPVSVVVELLGYLGGVLAIIGAVLLAARFWQDLATWTRLSLLGVVAAALWAAGAMVHEHADPALWRLRGVLWLLSSAAVAFFAALFAADVLELSGEAGPWWPGWRRRPTQGCCGGGGLGPCSSWPAWPGWWQRPAAAWPWPAGARRWWG